MNIHGEKIILRSIEMEDNEVLLEMQNDPDTENLLGGSSFPVSSSQQEKWFKSLENEKNTLRCIIATKENINKAIGTIVLTDIDYKNGTAQVHIKLSSKNGRQKGFGTDAMQTILNYALDDMRLNCIYAHVLSDNIPSQKLFSKCGFTQEGVLLSRVYKQGEYKNLISYSFVKKDGN